MSNPFLVETIHDVRSAANKQWREAYDAYWIHLCAWEDAIDKGASARHVTKLWSRLMELQVDLQKAQDVLLEVLP